MEVACLQGGEEGEQAYFAHPMEASSWLHRPGFGGRGSGEGARVKCGNLKQQGQSGGGASRLCLPLPEKWHSEVRKVGYPLQPLEGNPGYGVLRYEWQVESLGEGMGSSEAAEYNQ